MNPENIYTPIDQVEKILKERWNNIELKNKVLEFLGNDLPDFIKENQHAFICRNIASPDAELRYFLEVADKVNLKPVCLEYIEDKFVSHNYDKYCLAKMAFDFGIGRDGERKFQFVNIIDFNVSNGKKFCDLKTLYDENFVDFHHNLFKIVFSENKDIIKYDFSDWIKRNGKIAKEYYEKYLTIFICYGVLFENFFSDENEIEFTKMVIELFQKIKKRFGFNPIIVKLIQDGSEQDYYWYSYQSFLKKIIDDKIKEK